MDFFESSYFTAFLLAVWVGFMVNNYSYLLSKKVKNVNAEQAHELIQNNRDLVILDVRTKQEYLSGHIAKAKSIPLSELENRIAELEKYKDKPVLLHCASGGRSPRAIKILLRNNFTDIRHLKRGLKGWSYGLK